MLKAIGIIAIIILIPLIGSVVAGGAGSSIVLAGSVVFCGAMAFLVMRSRWEIGMEGRSVSTIDGETLSGENDEDREKESREFLTKIFISGLLLRVALALLVSTVDTGRYLDADASLYEHFGRMLASYWSGDSYYPPLSVMSGPNKFYYFYNGVLAYLFGSTRIIPQLINCIIGSLVVLYAYSISKVCFGDKTARAAAVLVAFYPSLIMWSIINVRDIWSVFAIVGSVYQIIKLKQELSISNFITLFVFMLLVSGLRRYLIPICVLAVLLSFLLGKSTESVSNIFIATGLIVLLAFSLNILGISIVGLEEINLENMNSMRKNLSLSPANTAYLHEIDISTPGAALRYLPVGLVYFLLAPFPWTVDFSVLRQALALPETIIWYFLVPKAFTGIRESFRKGISQANVILYFFICLLIPYAMVEGNVGTAYRHRSQIVALILIYAAFGYVRGKARKGEPLSVEVA